MGTLTQEDVRSFQEQGYILSHHQVFAPAQFAELSEIFEEQLAHKGGKLSDELDTPHFRDERLLTFLLSDEVLDLIEPLIGPNIALWSSHFICKDPYTGRATPWHEDSAFWEGRCSSYRDLSPRLSTAVYPRAAQQHTKGAERCCEREPFSSIAARTIADRRLTQASLSGRKDISHTIARDLAIASKASCFKSQRSKIPFAAFTKKICFGERGNPFTYIECGEETNTLVLRIQGKKLKNLPRGKDRIM